MGAGAALTRSLGGADAPRNARWHTVNDRRHGESAPIPGGSWRGPGGFWRSDAGCADVHSATKKILSDLNAYQKAIFRDRSAPNRAIPTRPRTSPAPATRSRQRPATRRRSRGVAGLVDSQLQRPKLPGSLQYA